MYRYRCQPRTRKSTTTPQQRTPSRARRDLTLDEIARRATTILREQGEAALTMRRVAAACGVTPMALYHHVENKDALIDAVMDVVLEPMLLDRPIDAANWRNELIEMMVRFYRALVDTPGAGTIFIRRPVVNRATAMSTDQAFQLLRAAGLRGDAIPRAMDAMVLLLFGAVSNDLTRPPDVRRELAGVVPQDETPLLGDHVDTYAARDPEARFRQALNWLLDGILGDRDDR